MEEYFCSKVQRRFDVSEQNYNICSICKESNSVKVKVYDTKESTSKIIGESLVCHYNDRNLEIPNPSFIRGQLGRIVRAVI